VAAAGSEVVLVDLDNLSSATNHNGGAIHFGPDGKLYAGVGENANSANAQTLSNRLGKILRYNSDGTIPTDNPFFGTATGANRAIWALACGIRSPSGFNREPAGCSSTTWARAPGRKSTTESLDRITAGRPAKVFVRRRT
jgi:glucose/arabinose dehydrogenase